MSAPTFRPPGRAKWTAAAALMLLVCVPLAAQQSSRDTHDKPPAGQQPVRDSRSAAAAGSGAIAGRIVTDDTARTPIRRAHVTITAVDSDAQREAYTDDAGAFAVSNLPAGRYVVTAAKAAYVRAAYGARRYDRPGTPVSVADGQQVTGLEIAMPRGAVITGAITDELGQPASGVMVRAMQYRYRDGQRQLQPVSAAGAWAVDTTDDLGHYRLYGLPAGDYVVSVTPPAAGAGDIYRMTDAVLSAAADLAQQPPPPAGSAPAAPPTPPTVGVTSVFYPGTAMEADAVTVPVGAGEERSGVNIPLQLVPTAKIAGVVVAPGGVAASSTQLLLVTAGDAGTLPLQLTLNRTSPNADGTFSFTGITPGRYTITARATPGGGSGGRGAGPMMTGPGGGIAVQGQVGGKVGPGGPMTFGGPAQTLWATADVSINGSDVSGVSLVLQPGMTVSGRVTVEAAPGTAVPTIQGTRLMLQPISPTGGLVLSVPAIEVTGDGSFMFEGVTPGRYRIMGGLNGSGDWALASASLRGVDTLDFPFEVAPNQNVDGLTVTFSNQKQEVSGALQDTTGRPAPDYTIVVFPADRALWPATRRIRTARPGTDGGFAVTGLPPGDYRIAAVTDIAPGDETDPAVLNELLPASVPITLRAGEKTVQDLRIAKQ